MLEMNGFRSDFTEAYWKGKLDRKEVKTTSGLFLLTYDLMRLHYRQVVAEGQNRQILTLGSNNDLVLGYEDYRPSGLDMITITADRGMVAEELRLPRDPMSNIMEEPMLYLRNYRSLLLQRELKEEEDGESCPELTETDIQNTAITVWRARSFK